MPTLKLSYFDFHGGRGEPARLALHLANLTFDDHRVTLPQFREMKPQLPFGSLPTLTVDGTVIAQSTGINRLVGKLTGLYPEDLVQAALCDEAMDAIEDMRHQVAPTFSLSDDTEKRNARVALAEGALGRTLTNLSQRLALRGGRYFADNRLTIADLSVFVWVRHLKSGTLDHLPTDLVDRVAPELAAHHDQIGAHEAIARYYAERS